jgi:hypothetical protein
MAVTAWTTGLTVPCFDKGHKPSNNCKNYHNVAINKQGRLKSPFQLKQGFTLLVLVRNETFDVIAVDI